MSGKNMAYLEMNNALGGKVPKSANRIIFELFTKIKTCQSAARTNIAAAALAECAKRDFLVSQLQQQHAASSYGIHNIVKILPNTSCYTEKDQGIWCDVFFLLIPNNFYRHCKYLWYPAFNCQTSFSCAADWAPAAPASCCAARHSRSTAGTGTKYQPGPSHPLCRRRGGRGGARLHLRWAAAKSARTPWLDCAGTSC